MSAPRKLNAGEHEEEEEEEEKATGDGSQPILGTQTKESKRSSIAANAARAPWRNWAWNSTSSVAGRASQKGRVDEDSAEPPQAE